MPRERQSKKDKRVEKHFSKKKLHTKIKHEIFQHTLRASISIANMQILRMPNTRKDFLYVDLFAGSGEFETGEKGSVLLAADIIKNHIFIRRSEKVKNHFHKFYILAIEKDKEAFEKLQSAIEKKKLPKQLKILPLFGHWEDYQEDLKKILSSFDWGFIFADPFSTELDILKFKELLGSKKYTKMKDILIFFNLQTLKRQKGRMLESDIYRLEKAIGLSWEEINSDKDLSDIVKESIEKNFSEVKDFAVGVAYPVEKEGTLTTMDYFYLILLTNSIALVNKFLEGYAEVIRSIKQENITSLFMHQTYCPKEDITLLEYWEEKIRRFLSWKNLINMGAHEVPTISNLVDKLNSCKRFGYIEFLCDGHYLYKRNGKYGRKGELKASSLKSKADLESIQIKVIR